MRQNRGLFFTYMFFFAVFAKTLSVCADDNNELDLFQALDGNSSQSAKTVVTSVKTDESQSTSENWLKSLISKGKNEILKNETVDADVKTAGKNKTAVQNKRNNAAFFDISGVKLRMTPKEVNQELVKQGYRQISQTNKIPNFIKWRAEELCRIHGVVGVERLNACATRVSQENGYYFIEQEVYNRYSTRESISVYYTSSFTGNRAHRIFYKSNLPMSFSKASKNVYINNLKIYDFWRRIDLKYGAPDNTSEVKWGLGGKKPYLQAGTGRLELVDPVLKDLDKARMFNEDTRLSNTHYYTF